MRTARQRRELLSRLEHAIDTGVARERQEAIRGLLATPLIPASDLRYLSVRKHAEWIRTWFSHHAEWSLTVTAEAARLRKTPADPGDGTRPCRTPGTGSPLTRRGYAYLCLALASLVRADRQTTLGNLAREIVSHLRAEPRFAQSGLRTDLDTREERRELVGAIRLLLAWGVLDRVHDDEERFVQNAQADALYNVNRPILGRILAADTPPSLVAVESFEQRLASTAGAVIDTSEEMANRRLRIRLFRHLLDDPVLYYDTLTGEEKAYLDRQRASILHTIEEATGLIREVRAEGIAMVDPSGTLTDYGLPEEGTNGHLTLLLAEHLASRARSASDEGVSLDELTAHTRECIRRHRKHWRKNVTEPGQDRALTEDIVGRLHALSLVERRGEKILPRPALGRYALRNESDSAAGERQPALI